MAISLSRRTIVGLAAIGLPAAWLVGKVQRLAAAPAGVKDCGPDVADGALQGVAGDDLPWSARGGTVNDVSCLSRTPVQGVIAVRSETDIAAALAFARANGLTLSMAGARHSMGGQAFAWNGVVLDMTGFNRIALNETGPSITVQSGASWHDIQNAIHPRFAVKAMQSSDVFTVGGSISVNAHGMDHRVGAIERTIRSMRVMLADGTILTASRTENADLYRHVVGGYGLFGIILDVELEITENAIYSSERRLIDYTAFPEVFEKEIAPDTGIALFYGHLSTAPGSFLRELILYTYRKTDVPRPELEPLSDVGAVGLRRLIFNLAKEDGFFREAKWYLEKNIEPAFESCTVRRAEAQVPDECLVSRNAPMHDSVPYLFNRLDYETDILHEYFIPRDRLVPFIDDTRTLMQSRETGLLNASVRVVHKEDIALSYAPADAFSLVLYINQSADKAGTGKMRRLTGDLIDLADRHGGRFFLPYRIHYTAEQLRRAYPAIGAFFAAKRRADPDGLFSNSFYETFGEDIVRRA